MNRNFFTNYRTLAGHVWRLNRVQIPVWVVSIAAFSVIMAAFLPTLFPEGPERQIIAQTMENPAMISMLGPGYGLANYHMGAIMAHQMLLLTAVTVAIMNILITIRCTRRDEEQGRIEMIRSLPVGKLANAASVFLVLTLTNIVLGLTVGIGLALLGLEGMDWLGSLTYGAVLTAAGIFFSAASLFFAQLTETARAASAYSFGFLGLSYLLRAVGDIGSEPLSLISPLGLVLRSQVYVNNYWWPLVVTLSAAVLVTLAAFKLNTLRDLEAGFIAAKPGRKHASPLLLSPMGLVLRLEKTTLIGWAVGLFVLGASYGSVFGEVENFIETSELYQQMLPTIPGFSYLDLFVAMLLSIMSMIDAIPALLVMLKLRSEEKANRTEHLLARSVSRARLMGSYTAVALITAAIMQVVSVLGLWTAAAAVVENPFALGEVLAGALAYVPLIWILIGLAAALIGSAPAKAGLTWLYLGFTFFVMFFGKMMQLPEWMAKLTPWGYIPDVPLEPINSGSLILTILAAAGLIGIGLYGYGKRDIYG